jgi:recombination protein RecA
MSIKEQLAAFKKKVASGSAFQAVKDVPYWVSTGCYWLDRILGGGIPGRNLTALAGAKSVGKSEILYQLIREYLGMEGLVLLIDSERSFTRTRAARTGFDPDAILYARPKAVDSFSVKRPGETKESKEQGVLDLVTDTIDLARCDFADKKILIGWDSVAATAVGREMTEASGTHLMGKHAQLVSQGLRKLMTSTDELDITFFFVNQLKEKIGVVFGKSTTYMAEKPLDFHSAITLEMVRISDIKAEDGVIGIRSKVTVTKNRVAPPANEPAQLSIYHKDGVNWWETVVDYLDVKKRLGDVKGWLILPSGEKFRKKDLVDKANVNPSVQDELMAMVEPPDPATVVFRGGKELKKESSGRRPAEAPKEK